MKRCHILITLSLLNTKYCRNRNKEWHDGRGHSIRVPIYLRYDGQVKNMNLDSTMTAEMIADVLRSKEEGHYAEVKMSDFLYNFINLKYSTTTLQMEFSYNLIDGIDRFKVSFNNKPTFNVNLLIEDHATYRNVQRRALPQFIRVSADKITQ